MSSKTFQRELAAIRADRTSGAAELARRCLEIIAENSLRDSSVSTRELLDKLNSRAQLLAGTRPSMVVLANLLLTFRQHVEKFSPLTAAEARKRCAATAEKIAAASIEAARDTAGHAAEFIGHGKSVFTLSYSSTVMQTFSLLPENDLRVIIAESRPLNEGFRLAQKLAALKIPTTLITDAQTGLFVKEADLVLVGADSIMEDFSTVNKAGTYLLALAARDNNIPFYVVSESCKRILPGIQTPEPEDMDPAELDFPELPGVTVRNIYFDLTPARLISGWINESGMQKINP